MGRLQRLMASPASPIFKTVSRLLDSKVWYRASGLIAAAVISHIVFSLLFLKESSEGALTFGVVCFGCALANIAAFASYRPQVHALIGESGLAPAVELLRRLKRVPFHRAPTVFRLFNGCTNRMLVVTCDVGLVCAAALACFAVLPWLAGDAGRLAATMLAPVLWLTVGGAYMSLVNVSGDFLGLQSDSNLVEVDALLAVLSLVAPGHPQAAVTVMRFFAFRKMLACGICKYYGSPMWRKFTALQVHYFTQPLVNPRSFYAHRLPVIFHEFSVMATFVVEVLLPFLAWGPRPLRLASWMGFNSMNAMINLSGNYGFIGFLNTAENLAFTDDALWAHLLPTPLPPWRAPLPLRVAAAALLAAYVAVSLQPLARAAKGTDIGLRTLGLPDGLVNWLGQLHEAQQPFRVVNYQGKFGGMHDVRWEPVLEASADGGATWRQFLWRYKLNALPGERGVVLWLHLPRLDWRVWFLPMAAARGKEPPAWYHRLMERLADKDPAVLRLLQGDPFKDCTEPCEGLLVRSRLVDCRITADGWQFEPLQHRTPLDLSVVARHGGTGGDDEGSPIKRPRPSL